MTVFKPTRIALTVLSVVLAFLLAITTAASALIWQQRQNALDNSAAQATRFVGGAVAALNRSLLGIDVLLASLSESLRLGEQQRDSLDRTAASKLMRSIVGRNLMLRRLALFDHEQNVLASSDPDLSNLPEIPAGFVAHVLELKVPSLLISAPTQHTSTGEHMLFLARHLRLADGSLVVVMAEIPVMQLNTIMVQGADISGLEVTLERSNGQLLAALPAQDKLLGSQLPDPLQQRQQEPQQRPARLSGTLALVSSQPILYDGALIAASIPIHMALTQWRTERNFIVWVALLFATMVVTAGGTSVWYLERMAQARQTIKQSKAEIEHLAFDDPLTGLPNRLLLMNRLAHTLISHHRSGHIGALLFLDLDNFKDLNDTLGHTMGDLLLQQVAKRLTQLVRANDTVARLGGDEFVILLENLSNSALVAAKLAEHIGSNLIAGLNEPYELEGLIHRTSASVGAALFGESDTSAADLLKQADIAMYQVKAKGRNGLCFFDPTMQARIIARAQLEADLRRAVSLREFLAFYQPQVNQDGAVIGAEVLIRWKHPGRGMVSPLEFITVAEESDVINQIGQWVLDSACAKLAQWQANADTAHLQLAVNVSARQFRQAQFVDLVRDTLDRHQVDAHGLKLELTESLVLVNIDDTIAKMSALKELHVRFSMDDFGTGQSSLSYLTRLPLDQLKIDQSFVRNIGIKPSDGMIVQTIIGMANNLGLEVIAEGVETREQQLFLAQHGCTLYQGYLFGKPGPIDQFEASLRTPATSS
jgi:diguanylate cyclase (GGDEF)-like protein